MIGFPSFFGPLLSEKGWEGEYISDSLFSCPSPLSSFLPWRREFHIHELTLFAPVFFFFLLKPGGQYGVPIHSMRLVLQERRPHIICYLESSPGPGLPAIPCPSLKPRSLPCAISCHGGATYLALLIEPPTPPSLHTHIALHFLPLPRPAARRNRKGIPLTITRLRNSSPLLVAIISFLLNKLNPRVN